MSTDRHHLQTRKLIYLITNGETTPDTTPASEDFSRLLDLAKAAVNAEIDLLQIREKKLSTRVLHELTTCIVNLTRGTQTKVLVNDRADVAAAAGADGVHLTISSIPANVIRNAFGDNFLIGVSTHSLAEADKARANNADFIVFGPIFETPTKKVYGEPQGLKQLEKITVQLGVFPVLALGGVSVETVGDCLRAGAQGVAAIRMLNDPTELGRIVNEIRKTFEQRQV